MNAFAHLSVSYAEAGALSRWNMKVFMLRFLPKFVEIYQIVSFMTPSWTTWLIMLHSKPPYEITDKQKHNNPKRTKCQLPVARFAQQKLQGIILNQGIWNDISTEPQNPFPIDVYGILSMGFRPVCQYIDQRSILNGKKAKTRLQHEQSYKQ